MPRRQGVQYAAGCRRLDRHGLGGCRIIACPVERHDRIAVAGTRCHALIQEGGIAGGSRQDAAAIDAITGNKAIVRRRLPAQVGFPGGDRHGLETGYWRGWLCVAERRRAGQPADFVFREQSVVDAQVIHITAIGVPPVRAPFLHVHAGIQETAGSQCLGAVHIHGLEYPDAIFVKRQHTIAPGPVHCQVMPLPVPHGHAGILDMVAVYHDLQVVDSP